MRQRANAIFEENLEDFIIQAKKEQISNQENEGISILRKIEVLSLNNNNKIGKENDLLSSHNVYRISIERNGINRKIRYKKKEKIIPHKNKSNWKKRGCLSKSLHKI